MYYQPCKQILYFSVPFPYSSSILEEVWLFCPLFLLVIILVISLCLLVIWFAQHLRVLHQHFTTFPTLCIFIWFPVGIHNLYNCIFCHWVLVFYRVLLPIICNCATSSGPCSHKNIFLSFLNYSTLYLLYKIKNWVQLLPWQDRVMNFS